MRRILVAAMAASLLAAACADPVPPPAPTPAVPTATEYFTGTVLVLGSDTKQFVVSQVGGLKVSLLTVSPSAAVGVGVGTPSSGSCLALDTINAVAGPGVQMSGTATVPGTYCVIVYDVGNMVEPIGYTLTVLHS
ncbi:MAG TPA: hypothetical protein VGH34_19595 [Vicinamibacterales bacterium]|jgi:opacity protein-like surface antigen